MMEHTQNKVLKKEQALVHKADTGRQGGSGDRCAQMPAPGLVSW